MRLLLRSCSKLAQRYLVLVALTVMLSGCIFEGITVPSTYRAWHTGAVEPVENLAVFMLVPEGGKSKAQYVRFIKTYQQGYVMEQYLEGGNNKVDNYFLLAAIIHFIPLGNNWYAMHSQSGTGQEYVLTSIKDGQLIISDLAPVTPRILELCELASIPIDAKPDKAIVIKELSNEKKLIEILKIVSAMPQTPKLSLTQITQLPPGVIPASMEPLSKVISGQEASGMEDMQENRHSIAYLRQLHREGNGWGSYGLARIVMNGWGLKQDAVQAKALAANAIERGVLQANVVFGYMAYVGLGEKIDYARAIPYLERAAKAGDPNAYTLLGNAYQNGNGVPIDTIEAKAWLERASKVGQSRSYSQLAMLLLDEHSNGSDIKAIELLNRGMKTEDAHAFHLRGWMHENGRGGAVDQVNATANYLEAAKYGYAYSQWVIGERMIAGTGTKIAHDEGLHWLRRAALAGIPEAIAAQKRYNLKPLIPIHSSTPEFDIAYGDENKNWGIEPNYSFTNIPHKPTPNSIPMVRIIKTEQLDRLLQKHPTTLVIDVTAGPKSISAPNAHIVADLGWPLSDPAQQQRADQVLHKLSDADKDRPIVFLCVGAHCWLSYNAARYAVHTGYQDVLWYRGGLMSWIESGRKIEAVKQVAW